MAAPAPPAIETRGLGKDYGDVTALRSLDLEVPRNAVFGFLGPNGAGKTTTIKLLLGLLRPTTGGGTVFGLDIVDDSIEVRRHVGYLAQEPRFYDHMTAREVLGLALDFFFDGPREALEDRVEGTLELAGLVERADRPVGTLSTGERQRLGIAQAQVHRPDLLILDEPTASLDPAGRREVLKTIEHLRGHATVFYSTHILSDVQRVSDTVGILDRGRLVAQEPIDRLLGGSSGPVYVVLIKGDGRPARRRIANLPWVSSVDVDSEADDQEKWLVTVTDEAAAEAHLLREVLSDRALTVTDFGRRRLELEDVFMDIVGGGRS